MNNKKIVIGFSNLDERNSFSIAVRQGLERVAAQYENITLVVRNNDLNTDQAKQNIQEFAELPVDLAMIFHSDERAGFNLITPLTRKGIPVISIEIRYPVTYFFGVDNFTMGREAGEVLGQWIDREWGGHIDKILVATASSIIGEIPKRFESALEEIAKYAVFSNDQILYLDSEMERNVIEERAKQVLKNWSELRHIAVICINDYVADGVLRAARALDRENDLAIISYDGTQTAIEELKNPSSRLIVSPAFYPERYGDHLIPLALQILAGESVPRQNFIPSICLTKENYQLGKG